jgi:hypothetical protein
MAPTATSWPMVAGHGDGCAGHSGDRRARSVREVGCINESTVRTDSGQGLLDGLTAANRVQLGDEESSDRLPSGRGPQNPQGMMLPYQGARACKAVRVVEPRDQPPTAGLLSGSAVRATRHCPVTGDTRNCLRSFADLH